MVRAALPLLGRLLQQLRRQRAREALRRLVRRRGSQVVVASKDGGRTFTAPITIAGVVDYPLTGTPFDAVDLFNRVPGMSARVDCYPHPASDPSSTRVYVVW